MAFAAVLYCSDQPHQLGEKLHHDSLLTRYSNKNDISLIMLYKVAGDGLVPLIELLQADRTFPAVPRHS